MIRNILKTVGLVLFAVIVLFGLTGYFAGEPALATAVVLLGAVGFFCVKKIPSAPKPTKTNKNIDSKDAARKTKGHALNSKGFAAKFTDDYVLSDKGEDIIRNAPPPDANFGFSNMPIFIVSGKKKTTNRKNTRTIYAVDEAKAIDYAIKFEGLVEPLEVTYKPFDAPYGDNEYDLPFPSGATRQDLFEFENSCICRDTKHIPAEFMEYAIMCGVGLSWLSGRNYAARCVFEKLDVREKAVLYGYAVHCYKKGITPGNVEKSKDLPLYIKFAEEACKDAKVWTSIENRPGDDIWKPAKNTIAYKFAESLFDRSAQPASVTAKPAKQTVARVGYRPASDIVKRKAPKYLVIDVETTGLSPDDDRIIEVAAVKCENDRIVDRFHSLINPGRPIPSRVTEITGINDSDVKNAPDMDEIAPKLSEFIEDLPLVAHNANFDIKFIANSFKRAGVSKGMIYIDTLCLARIAFPDMPNHKLSTLIDEFGLSDHAQEHRAMSDAEATQRLYMICKSQLVK